MSHLAEGARATPQPSAEVSKAAAYEDRRPIFSSYQSTTATFYLQPL